MFVFFFFDFGLLVMTFRKQIFFFGAFFKIFIRSTYSIRIIRLNAVKEQLLELELEALSQHTNNEMR